MELRVRVPRRAGTFTLTLTLNLTLTLTLTPAPLRQRTLACPTRADPLVARRAWRADHRARERAARTKGRPPTVVGHLAVQPPVAHGRRQGEADRALQQASAELSRRHRPPRTPVCGLAGSHVKAPPPWHGGAARGRTPARHTEHRDPYVYGAPLHQDLSQVPTFIYFLRKELRFMRRIFTIHPRRGSSRLCVSCSPVRDSLESGGPGPTLVRQC